MKVKMHPDFPLFNPYTLRRIAKFCDGIEGGYRWDLEKVARNGHLGLMKYMHKAAMAPEFASVRVMDAASEFGHMAMVEWLHSNRSEGPGVEAGFLAANNGHFDIARFLYKHYHIEWGHRVFSGAAKHGKLGHLDLFLEDYFKENPGSETYPMMDALTFEAIASGHLAVSEWLLQRSGQKSPKGDSKYSEALRKAAQGGHLDILKYGHSSGWAPITQGWSALAPEAAKNGHAHVVHWLLDLKYTSPEKGEEYPIEHPTHIAQSLKASISSGHMRVLTQLHANYPGALAALDSVDLYQLLVSGNLAMLEWLFDTAPGLISNQIQENGANQQSRIIAGGHLPLLKWLRLYFPLQFAPNSNELECAAKAGFLDMVEWLVSSGSAQGGAFEGGTIPLDVGRKSLVYAAAGGHYNVVNWLLHRPEAWGSNSMSATFRAAFCAGKDRTARLLHEYLQEEGNMCGVERATGLTVAGQEREGGWMPSQQTLSSAISEGHLGCLALAGQIWGWGALDWPPLAADLAVRQVSRGHRVETLQFLHKWLPASARPLASRLGALATAARRGDALAVRWLHEHLYRGVATAPAVLDFAAAAGHLEVVRFLTERRPGDGASARALDLAAGNGHLGVVRYLHRRRTEGCTAGAAARAAVRGHRRVLVYLLEHGLVPSGESDVLAAVRELPGADLGAACDKARVALQEAQQEVAAKAAEACRSRGRRGMVKGPACVLL